MPGGYRSLPGVLVYANPAVLLLFPRGAQGPREHIDATHNSAILIDTDEVFHGVERVTPRRE